MIIVVGNIGEHPCRIKTDERGCATVLVGRYNQKIDDISFSAKHYYTSLKGCLKGLVGMRVGGLDTLRMVVGEIDSLRTLIEDIDNGIIESIEDEDKIHAAAYSFIANMKMNSIIEGLMSKDKKLNKSAMRALDCMRTKRQIFLDSCSNMEEGQNE